MPSKTFTADLPPVGVDTISFAPPPDPWIHRSDRMKCMTCMYFVAKQVLDPLRHTELGRCRRHAPTMSGFPVVFPSDWCGDHKLDEEKL